MTGNLDTSNSLKDKARMLMAWALRDEQGDPTFLSTLQALAIVTVVGGALGGVFLITTGPLFGKVDASAWVLTTSVAMAALFLAGYSSRWVGLRLLGRGGESAIIVSMFMILALAGAMLNSVAVHEADRAHQARSLR